MNLFSKSKELQPVMTTTTPKTSASAEWADKILALFASVERFAEQAEQLANPPETDSPEVLLASYNALAKQLGLASLKLAADHHNWDTRVHYLEMAAQAQLSRALTPLRRKLESVRLLINRLHESGVKDPNRPVICPQDFGKPVRGVGEFGASMAGCFDTLPADHVARTAFTDDELYQSDGERLIVLGGIHRMQVGYKNLEFYDLADAVEQTKIWRQRQLSEQRSRAEQAERDRARLEANWRESPENLINELQAKVARLEADRIAAPAV